MAEPSARTHERDPNAYPRERLTHALEASEARFQGLGALPDCKPLVVALAARARCTDAANAVSARASARSRAVSDAERMRLAADVALSAQRAAEVLRERGVARLLEGRPNASPSAGRPAPSASAPRPPRPAPSASAGRAMIREQSDPDLDAIAAYSRVASIALAELRAYLEFAHVTLRGLAVSEVARLSQEQPHWAALRALIDEARLVESEPALAERLSALQKQLGAP